MKKDFKLLKIQIGADFLNQRHVTIDTNHVFMRTGVNSIYPQILSIKNSKIINVANYDSQSSEKIF